MADEEHSLLSASGAPRWIPCNGSIALEGLVPNQGSTFAAEGTAIHGLGAFLLSGRPNKEITQELLNRMVSLNCPVTLASDFIGETIIADGQSFVVDHEFADAVQKYVDYCRSLGGMAFVETRVNYANWLGVPTTLAWGTSDFYTIHEDPEVVSVDAYGWPTNKSSEEVVLTGRLICTNVDLKGGKGVAVSPKDNEQQKLYLGGVLNEIEMIMEVQPTDILRMVIHQPRIGAGDPQEWYISVADLKRWLQVEAAMAAQHAVAIYSRVNTLGSGGVEAVSLEELNPGDKQCRFCNAKAICPKLTQHVLDTVANKFIDLSDTSESLPKKLSAAIDVMALSPTELSEKLRAADLIEATVKAWRARAEGLMFEDPKSVPGFKLVRGKKGARSWADAEIALKKLKTYLGAKFAVKPVEPISPTTVENDFKKKGKLSPKQWAELQKIITQSDGGISIAPESDPREAVDPRPSAANFTDLTEEASNFSHLI